MCNNAVDNAIHACVQSLDSVASNIGSDMKVTTDWYRNNEMAVNHGKFRQMFMGLKNYIGLLIGINGIAVELTDSAKLLVVAKVQG